MTDDATPLRDAVTAAREYARDRAVAILHELSALERDAAADWITDDQWQSLSIAMRYRELLREWWQLPSQSATQALYNLTIDGTWNGDDDHDPGLPFRTRCLTKAADTPELSLCLRCRSDDARDAHVRHTCRRVRAKPGERDRLRQQRRLRLSAVSS